MTGEGPPSIESHPGCLTGLTTDVGQACAPLKSSFAFIHSQACLACREHALPTGFEGW